MTSSAVPTTSKTTTGLRQFPSLFDRSLKKDTTRQIAELIQDSLSDVASDLEEVVREQLKQELAGFRDAVRFLVPPPSELD
jgi:BMFP domain-containing protein YqiC